MNKKTKKRTLSMALAAALAFSPVQAFAASSDIAGHWAEDVITQWENAGMISGYEDGTFRPNNSVTRAEFVIMMNNALGLTETGEVSFSDVQPGNWFYNAVAIAVAAGYCSGYEDGTFKPSATITRAEAAVMIANAAGLEQDATGAAGFTDSIPAWAQGSVGAVVNAGFMSGYPDGTFAANQSITRAEAVSSLNRVIGGVTANDVVVTEATEIADQTIDGNLIIDAALTDGTVTVKNTTVKGNIVVRGGSAEALKLDGVTVEGKLIVEKEGAEVVLTGETKVPSVEISALSTLSEDNFKGSVGTITVTKNLDTDKTVKLSVAADKLVLDGTAAVDVNKDIKTVEITKDAEGSKVYVNKGATVDIVVADAKANVSGSGTVKVLEANSDGITLGSSLTVNKTEVAEGVEKPTTSTGGGGGGGGGSSTTDDDDDIPTPQYEVTDTTTWADVVKAVNGAKSTHYKVVVKDTTSLGTITNDDASTLKFSGNGTLTIDFQNTTVTAGNMKIEAPNAARIELVDDATGTNGVQLTSLTINAPKATVNDNFVATTRDIKEVSDATFNVKDNDGTTTVNIGKGTVNVAGVSGTVNVNVNGTGPVTVKGTVQDVDVLAAGENANVTIAGVVTGNVNNTGTAAIINVVDGANITNLETKAKATYNVKGGKVDTLNLTTAPASVTATGGTIDTLTLATNSLTVAGATVGTATVSTGKLTVNSGSVAKATVDTGKVEGTGKVGTVEVTGASATVGVETVDTINLGASATPVTVNSKTVGTIEAGATSGQITLVNDAKVNALIATAETTLVDNTAGNTGKIGTVVAVDKKVTVQDAKQVGSVKVSGTGSVEDASGPISGVEKTEISKVTLTTEPETTQYYKDQELNLSDMVLTVEQTVTGADGKVSSGSVNLTYDQAKDLLTGDELFDSTTVGADKTLTFKYAGLPVNDAKGQPYTYTYDVVLSQAQFEEAAKKDLIDAVKGTFTGENNTSVDARKGWTATLPMRLGLASAGNTTAQVEWVSKNTEFVTAEKSGANYHVEAVKAPRGEAEPVTLTATVTSGEYTATVVFTVNVEAENKGAVEKWNGIADKLVSPVTVPVNTATTDPSNPAQAQQAIQGYLDATFTNITGYTLKVKEGTMEKSGNNWKATLRLESSSAAATDYVENVVTFSLVDQAAGAKTELEKLAGLTSVALPSGTISGSSMQNDVETVIKADATKRIDSEKYEVSVATTSCIEADGTVTWKGKITVTSKGADSATNKATDAEDRTITATEGQDITFGAKPISGKTNAFTDTDVTLTAGNTAFVGVQVGDDVTSWFVSPNGSLPAGLKAKVKSLGTNDTVLTVTIYLPKDTTCAATEDAIALTATVPQANLKDAKSDLVADGGSSTTIDIKHANEDIKVQNVTAAEGSTTFKITLKNGTFDQTEGAKAENYLWNGTKFTGTAKVSDDQKSVSIALSKDDKKALGFTGIDITIKGAVFGESVVTAENVTVEYMLTQLTKDNLVKANIDDPTVEGDLFTKHEIEVGDTLSTDSVNVVKVTTTDLVQHKNNTGTGKLGYWTGFAVTAPEGAGKMNYTFSDNKADLDKPLAYTNESLEVAVDGGTKEGIGFFVNVTNPGPDVKKYGAVQFCDASGSAITPVYKFEIDLSGVSHANKGIEIATTGSYEVTGADTAALPTGTGAIEFTGNAPTPTELVTALEATLTEDSAKATLKVVSSTNATSVNDAYTFDDATAEADTVETGDVLFVLSADRSVVGKYTITVTPGA